MDLVEGGDVRRLFSDSELLKLVGVEEEYEKRSMNGARKPGDPGNANNTTKKSAEATGDGGRLLFPTAEGGALGEDGQGQPANPTGSEDEVRTPPGHANFAVS